MVNNLEGMIWTEKELMLFCLSEKSDDEFDIASCGLGKLQGFRINDCITSNRWEKSWFVNAVDGLIYELGWKVYHEMIEELETLKASSKIQDEDEEEPINLVTCALKHKIDPVNIHYMMNFTLHSKFGSLRMNKTESLLGFPAQHNKLILLTELENPSPKVYTTVFLGEDETIRDFQFLEEKMVVVLTVTGYLKIY